MQRRLNRLRRGEWVLVAILALALGLRLWGIGFGLPYLYHADENVPVSIALRILQTGDLNPRFFNWPSLLIYLNAIVYAIYFVVGRVTGRFASPADLPFPDLQTMAVGRAALPEELLLGRALSAVTGTLAVLVVYLICKRLAGSREIGWLGALLFAVEPMSIRNSQYIRPDTLAIFFALVTVLAALSILDDPRGRNYLWAGVAVGLAASSKYNLALACVAVIVAHVLRWGWQSWRKPGIYAAGAASVAAFAATTSYAILDSQRFVDIGPLQDASIYATGHPGAEGDTLQWYVSMLSSQQGAWTVLALAALALVLWRRDRKGFVVVAFPAVYFVFVNLYTVHFETTFLPLVPFICILAAVGVQDLAGFLRLAFGPRRVRSIEPVRSMLAIAIALVLAVPALVTAAENNVRVLSPDGREAARQWMEANLPPGSRVAVESYAPYADPKQFIVAGFYGLQDHAPDWYVANGYEYLVASEGAYGRYFLDPGRYAAEVGRYDALFERFATVARFDDNSFEVRVLKTGVTLPAHRVGARFGDGGDLIELVGFEDEGADLALGTLTVVLYWRGLRDKPEPMAVELNLLDRDDQVVATREGDLFQGKGWQARVFETAWTFALPAGTKPGVYRLQVNPLQTRYSYRPPVVSWQGEQLAVLELAPIKVNAAPPSSAELQAVRPVTATYANQIALTGYLPYPQTSRPGTDFPLTLFWQSLVRSGREYTLFVHLLDQGGRPRAQADLSPQDGRYPTSVWDAGETFRDDYVLPLPPDMPPGKYRVEVGWFTFPTLGRLTVTGVGGRVLGDSFLLPDEVVVR